MCADSRCTVGRDGEFTQRAVSRDPGRMNNSRRKGSENERMYGTAFAFPRACYPDFSSNAHLRARRNALSIADTLAFPCFASDRDGNLHNPSCCDRIYYRKIDYDLSL